MKTIDDAVLYDLGISRRVQRGEKLLVRHCYHFCSDGTRVDELFRCREDYIVAMNLIAVTSCDYPVLILAFCLMDNHFHFVLYGEADDCSSFVREYVRRLGISMTKRTCGREKLDMSMVSYKEITDADYLKTVICYVHRNPPAGRLPYPPWLYPYSSGNLLFAGALEETDWCIPRWMRKSALGKLSDLSYREMSAISRSENLPKNWRVCGQLIFPGEYVATGLVERIFGTPRAYLYFLGACRDKELDTQCESFISMSIPDKEMRVIRDEVLGEMFPGQILRHLSVTQRAALANRLKSRYGCPAKQLARMVNLSYPALQRWL